MQVTLLDGTINPMKVNILIIEYNYEMNFSNI